MQVRGTNQHIPINEGRILQKDWLRGYKPIEVPKKENGGWLEKYNDGGPIQPNYNDYSVSAPEGFQGDGYSNVGRNYSPAWGGQFAMGGSIPGSVGFMYARTNDPAPSNGKYAKKTKASAQDGTELENAYSKWPALRNMGTAAVNKDYGLGLGLGYGGVEFMHPDLKEVNYDNGVLVNQSPGKNSTTYNPLTDDAQSVRLDMLHGMHQDPTFSKHRDAFKQSVLSDPSIKGDMNHWYNEDKKKGRAGDGKDQWTNNYIDGQMRTLLFEGDRKSRNYSDEEANQLLANPKIKKSFNKLNDYLKAGYSYGQGPRANNGAEMKYYQNGLDWKPRSMDDGGEVVPGENEELQIPSAWDDKMASIKKTRLRGPGTRTRFMPPQLLDEDQFEVEDVNYDQLSAPHFVNSLTPVESKNYIPKMQDRFTDMENMYYTKNAEFNENWSNLNLLDESSNKIKLNTGRFTGAKVPTNIIDELAKTSRKQNVSLGQLLTLMGRESMFGSGTDRNEDRAGSKTSLMSGWNVAEDYQPYNNIRFLADNKVPGVKPTPTPHGYEYEITDERAMNNYLRKNPKLLDQYKAKLDSTKVLGDQDAFDLAAKFLKKKGIKGYNPGDPRYEEMFQKDYDTLKQDKALMSYLKKKGYKYEQGGEMRYYQEGLDFKPKSISKNGSNVIKDDRGQWAYPGEITEIGSNQITMQGVPYPVLGISDTGDTQMMYPNEEYQYDGESVTEYPMMAEGGKVATDTSMPRMVKTNKKSSVINKQEELPLYYGPNVFENCVGAGCSKLATTETANLYGVSYDALSPQDAWYKKAAVLKDKGKEIWDPSKSDYSSVRIGDFVSMDRFGHDHDRDVSPIKGFTLADNEKIEHVGSIIGRNEKGIPLVKHGSEHGKVYVQPITDLFLPDANDINLPLYYKPKSIYRSAAVENLDLKNKKYYTKPGKIDPIVWQNPTETPTENEKKYLDAINKNAPMQQLVYGLTPEETKKINEVSWGIFHNETKAGATSKPVGGKMIAASLLHAFGRDNAASLGDVQIKYDDLMFNKDGSISKTGRLMQEMGVNRDGLYSPLEHRKDYNDEVNSVAAALATSLDKIKNNPTKYKYNSDKNTVYGNIPVDEALATIYRLGTVGFKESALRKHLSYGKAAATHVNRDIEPSKKPVVNVGGQPLFAKLPKKEQGGQLTKLDQLTNFTNYNTKQPGGWLDKYQ